MPFDVPGAIKVDVEVNQGRLQWLCRAGLDVTLNVDVGPELAGSTTATLHCSMAACRTVRPRPPRESRIPLGA